MPDQVLPGRVPVRVFVPGWMVVYIRFRIRLRILRLALSSSPNPWSAYQALRSLINKRKTLLGTPPATRYIQAGNRYFWTLASPGWPSPAFDDFVRNELDKVRLGGDAGNRLHTMIFSITSRCPLRCDHCYEWNNLASVDSLSYDDLEQMLKHFQAYGVATVEFSGGEPLSRFDDLVRLLQTAQTGTDFWILSSGFELTADRARRLKDAGLTGVAVSLDHWKEEEHNRYRNHGAAFQWAREAIRNSLQAELVVALSLCARKEFVSRSNLEEYVHLASEWGVGLVRILEPRQAGHYQGLEIELEEEQIGILDQFYLDGNAAKAGRNWPILEYAGYHQRRFGCFGAGDRYLYVDSQGFIHACPFCQKPAGNARVDLLEEVIPKLRKAGCHKFPTQVREAEVLLAKST